MPLSKALSAGEKIALDYPQRDSPGTSKRDPSRELTASLLREPTRRWARWTSLESARAERQRTELKHDGRAASLVQNRSCLSSSHNALLTEIEKYNFGISRHRFSHPVRPVSSVVECKRRCLILRSCRFLYKPCSDFIICQSKRKSCHPETRVTLTVSP